MLYRTHALGGFVLGYAITHDLRLSAVCAASALIADIDSPHSFVGRKAPGVSHALSATLKHRGALHSLLAALAVFMVSSHLFDFATARAVFWGYISHLMLDGLTEGGVPLFYPLKKHFSIPLFTTASIFEKFIFLPALYLYALYALTLVSRSIF